MRIGGNLNEGLRLGVREKAVCIVSQLKSATFRKWVFGLAVKTQAGTPTAQSEEPRLKSGCTARSSTLLTDDPGGSSDTARIE